MKTFSSSTALAVFLITFIPSVSANPQLASWFTADSGRYARLYQSTAAETAQTASTTWSRGAGVQTTPTYAGVHEISHSTHWVYIRTTGLASHLMGPWYLNAAKTQNFPNFPSNTATIYRIPRVPSVPATKSLTGGGAIGYFVNGVAFFDNRDTFSYSNSRARDADPTAGIGNGDLIWNRDAYANEGVTFDAGLAHQAGKQYHYHAQPIALRYQLGDHVDHDATTNRYSESTGPVTKHSPILAWAADGFPVYGPYGYALANDPNSGVRRIVSGYVPRNGSNGTTNLPLTGRHTLPAWAAVAQNRNTTLATTQYGPAVNATYALGHYLEDYDHLGDLGQPQGAYFDLDKYNGRLCVTPEFPGETYAYFSTINADGSPAFPFNIGRQFYGSPSGGSVNNIAEVVTTVFRGGPNVAESPREMALDRITGTVTLTWSAVEGGNYRIERSEDLGGWTPWGSDTTARDDSLTATDTGAALSRLRYFYRAKRQSLAPYDGNGFNLQ